MLDDTYAAKRGIPKSPNNTNTVIDPCRSWALLGMNILLYPTTSSTHARLILVQL
jgi:hypothetical protein